jgi:hypothetical protein
MAERGVSRSAALSLGTLALTQSQVQAFIDVAILLDTTVDFLRFVTEFFEVIDQSVPHLYHAVLLSPLSSVVRKLYGHFLDSPMSKAVIDIPASWDSCMASARATIEANHVVWSPRGQLIAVGWVDRVELRDPDTLEIVSLLKPSSRPGIRMPLALQSLAFSPDGCMLACTYYR